MITINLLPASFMERDGLITRKYTATPPNKSTKSLSQRFGDFTDRFLPRSLMELSVETKSQLASNFQSVIFIKYLGTDKFNSDTGQVLCVQRIDGSVVEAYGNDVYISSRYNADINETKSKLERENSGWTFKAVQSNR